MTLVRWDAFHDVSALQSRMNKIFEDTLGKPLAESGGEHLATGVWTPAVDISETAEKIVMKAEVPGIPQEEIDIQVSGGVLTLKGERSFQKEDKAASYHRVERAYGQFVRSFALPASIDAEKIAASYDAGVLTIDLPKREETKPKQIHVKVGGSKK